MLGRSKTRFNLGEVVIADCACYLVHIAATYGRRAPAAKKLKNENAQRSLLSRDRRQAGFRFTLCTE